MNHLSIPVTVDSEVIPKFSKDEEHDKNYPLSALAKFCIEAFTLPIQSYRRLSSVVATNSPIETIKSLMCSLFNIEDAGVNNQYYYAKEFTISGERRVMLRIISLSEDAIENSHSIVIPYMGIIYHANFTTLKSGGTLKISDIIEDINKYIMSSFPYIDTKLYILHKSYADYIITKILLQYNYDKDTLVDIKCLNDMKRNPDKYITKLIEYATTYSSEELLDQAGILYIREYMNSLNKNSHSEEQKDNL